MKHIVKRGECLSIIAEQYGFKKLETIWDHPENKELKEKRKNMNILFEGDKIYIPDKEPKKLSARLCSVNKYIIPVKKTYLRLRLLNRGQPRANEELDLKLVFYNKKIHCTTDADGKIEEIIPDNLRHVTFRIGKNKHYCYLDLAHLNPIDKYSGIRARLKNLHFHCHRLGGKGAYDPYTIRSEKGYIENSIKRFQFAFDKKETGEHDDELEAILEDKHEKDQSWTCEPKDGEIPYKLPNRTRFFIAKNTWNTIDIVDSPDIVLDAHMHIQSANCAPLPLTWSSIHRVAVLVRAKRSILQDKTPGAIDFIVRKIEWGSDKLPGPPGFVARAVSGKVSTTAGPIRDLIEVSNKHTSKIGDDVIKKNKKTYQKFYEKQPDDNLSSMIVMPMDMEFAHIDGYGGEGKNNNTIYTLVEKRYYLIVPSLKDSPLEFVRERAIGEKVLEVKQYKHDQMDALSTDDSVNFINHSKTRILLPPDVELGKIDPKYIEEETGKFYYSNYRYDINQKGEKYWMADEEHALYETYESQIQHTLATAAKYPFEIIPMYHYDPRRWKNNYSEPFDKYFDKGNYQLFIGLKMYTALGYKPWDEELWEYGQKDVYAKCQKDKIPILCHCTPEGMVTIDRPMYAEKDLKTDEEMRKAKAEYKMGKDAREDGKLKDNKNLVESFGLMKGISNKIKSLAGTAGELVNSISPIKREQLFDSAWKKHYFRENYVAPKAWEKVLKVYPDLRLCLAHFGGDQKGYANWNEPMFPDLWDEEIIKLIETYNHVYTDLSFFDIKKQKDKFKSAIREHPKLLEKVMFGTDWFLIVGNGKEYQPYCEEARTIIKEIEEELKDDSLWLRFTRINPMRFYRIKENAEKLYNGWEKAIELANKDRREDEILVTENHIDKAKSIREKNYKIIKELRL